MSIQGARLHQTGGAIHRSGAVVNDLFQDARQRVAGSRIDVYAPQVADLERTQAGHRLGRFAPASGSGTGGHNPLPRSAWRLSSAPRSVFC